MERPVKENRSIPEERFQVALLCGLAQFLGARQLRPMKIIGIILLLALLIGSNGCATSSTVKRAKGEQLLWSDAPDTTKHPAYYCFIPLTVPFDIATSPIQIFFLPEIFGIGPSTNHLDGAKRH